MMPRCLINTFISHVIQSGSDQASQTWMTRDSVDQLSWFQCWLKLSLQTDVTYFQKVTEFKNIYIFIRIFY